MAVKKTSMTATNKQLRKTIQIRKGLCHLNDKTEYTRCMQPVLTTYLKPASESTTLHSKDSKNTADEYDLKENLLEEEKKQSQLIRDESQEI